MAVIYKDTDYNFIHEPKLTKNNDGSYSLTDRYGETSHHINLNDSQLEVIETIYKIELEEFRDEIIKKYDNDNTLVPDDPTAGDLQENPLGIIGSPNVYKDLSLQKRQYILNNINSLLKINVPDWSYLDWIKERTSFQKCLACGTDELGWFYFKVFFDFSNGGLLGNILNDDITTTDFYNYYSRPMSAARYLLWNSGLYKKEKLSHRYNALIRFVKLLNDIVYNRPYLITSVKGINSAFNVDLKEINKEKTIELGFLQDPLNMDIGKLFDLYRFIAYDNIYCKEILPENTRKFDMTICLFSTPIRYIHTGIKSKTNGSIDYKSMRPDGNDFSNMMSYKMITFKNCEFDLESLGDYYGSDLKNESPFNLGNNSVKIKYDKAIHHRMDEWNQIFFGDTGILYDLKNEFNKEKNLQETRINSIVKSIGNNKFNPNNTGQYKELIDATELLIQFNAASYNSTPQYVTDYYHTHKNDFIGKLKAIKKGTIKGKIFEYDFGPGTEYFKQRLKLLHNKGEDRLNFGGLYEFNYNENDSTIDFKYFHKKLEMLKYGVTDTNIGELNSLKSQLVRTFNPVSSRLYLQKYVESSKTKGIEYTYEGINKINKFFNKAKNFSISGKLESLINKGSGKLYDTTGGLLAF